MPRDRRPFVARRVLERGSRRDGRTDDCPGLVGTAVLIGADGRLPLHLDDAGRNRVVDGTLGTAEFYRTDGPELVIEATVSGVSSHALGSHVLDGGFAADVDADGRPELVVTDDARTSLVAISRTKDGATTTAPRWGPRHVEPPRRQHGGGAPGCGYRGGLRVW